MFSQMVFITSVLLEMSRTSMFVTSRFLFSVALLFSLKISSIVSLSDCRVDTIEHVGAALLVLFWIRVPRGRKLINKYQTKVGYYIIKFYLFSFVPKHTYLA